MPPTLHQHQHTKHSRKIEGNFVYLQKNFIVMRVVPDKYIYTNNQFHFISEGNRSNPLA